MPRYCIVVEYEGTPYIGWQRQERGQSVQGTLESAAASLVGENITLHGAGRTDSGVHALGQVAHFSSNKQFSDDSIRDGLNYYLKSEKISVLQAAKVSENFHARFSAIRRSYMYRIINRRSPLSIESGRAWHVPVLLDNSAMHFAAQKLVGFHDFSTFRAAHCQARSPLKTLENLDVSRKGNEIFIHTSAKSFLHNQVRSIVGSLKLIGEGKWSIGDIEAALTACDRSRSGPVAPSMGLYLVKVDYGSDNNVNNATN